jgi:hypothetical protein
MSAGKKLRKLLNSKNVIEMIRTGSSVICNPPVTDTDIDVVIFVNKLSKFHSDIDKISYAYHDSMYSSPFGVNVEAYTYKNYNFIVTSNHNTFKKFKWATALATKLNIKDKAERAALFKLAVHNEYVSVSLFPEVIPFEYTPPNW